ncbi:MAG: hypothetical protein ABSB55_08180 [Acidimicrobiales bacterium]
MNRGLDLDQRRTEEQVSVGTADIGAPGENDPRLSRLQRNARELRDKAVECQIKLRDDVCYSSLIGQPKQIMNC